MPGVLQVTFYTTAKSSQKTKKRQQQHQQRAAAVDLPISWSLPAVILPSSTPNEFQHPVVLQERVARGLGLLEGDWVCMELDDYRDTSSCTATTSGTSSSNRVDPSVKAWLQGGGGEEEKDKENISQQQEDSRLFRLRISIDPSAAFDVAIEANSERIRRHHKPIFGGTVHTPLGNFLLCGGQRLKLWNEQRMFQANKTSKELNGSGMLIQVEGLADSFLDGAIGCGYCIYASSPLSKLKPSDLMVQGFRFLGNQHGSSSTDKSENKAQQEAAMFGLWEALNWISRLDCQMIWIVGSEKDLFRQVLLSSSSSEHTSQQQQDESSPASSPLMRYLHQNIMVLLNQARDRRIQFKFLTSEDTEPAMDLATQAIFQQRNETWCHWDTIQHQCSRPLPFSKAMARQVSI